MSQVAPDNPGRQTTAETRGGRLRYIGKLGIVTLAALFAVYLSYAVSLHGAGFMGAFVPLAAILVGKGLKCFGGSVVIALVLFPPLLLSVSLTIRAGEKMPMMVWDEPEPEELRAAARQASLAWRINVLNREALWRAARAHCLLGETETGLWYANMSLRLYPWATEARWVKDRCLGEEADDDPDRVFRRPF